VNMGKPLFVICYLLSVQYQVCAFTAPYWIFDLI
jgi:hypothetical protein